MPQRPQRPPGLVGRVFPARLAIQNGLISRDQLRGSAWRRLFHGIYADATLADTHRLRCAAALRWLLPDSTVVAGGPPPPSTVPALVRPPSRSR